jgi:hypothetical protein
MGSAALIAESDWSSPVLPQDVSTPSGYAPDPKYTDPAVLSIVVQDYQTASQWMTDRMWVLHWRESDTLYQSPRTQATFDGSSVSRSNVSRFGVAKAVNSLAPAMTGAVFSDTTPFEIRPRPNVHQNSARAWKELISILLELCDFKPELSYGIEGMCNQGTVIFKMGWEEYTEKVTHYERKSAPVKIDMPLGGQPLVVFTKESDEFEEVTEEVVKKRPIFEKCELGTIYPNPKWKNPNQMWKCGWLVQEFYLNYEDLVKLRENPDYDIPDDDTLRGIFLHDVETTESVSMASRTMSGANAAVYHAAPEDRDDLTEDPLLKPMQVLEWWDKAQVRTVLQQKVVIRNDKHKLGSIPFLSANFWNIENAGWGMGVGRIAGSDQRIDQGITNAALDIIAYAVQPETVIARGANVPTQDQRRRLGGIRLVDGPDVTKAVMLVPQPQVPADAWRALQVSQQTADSTTGADQAAVQGSLPGRGSSVGRSGTGAGMLQAASQGRLQAPVERIVDGILIPFLNFVWYNVRQRMTVSEIRGLLGQHLSDAILVDFHDFLNAELKFDTLAGTRLAARGRMAQALPFLLEVFGNQALVTQMSQIGWKVNVLELADMVMDVSEWKNRRDLVVPMTDQEKQTMAQNNPATQKAQADAQQQQQKHTDDMQLEDMKIHGRIATQTVKDQTKKLIESPLERATAYAERSADERSMQSSQFYGPTGGYSGITP